MHPKQLLAQHGLEAKKSLGQNFLFDHNVLARIADAAALKVDDAVLEIGPGLGALTQHLARQAGRVVAVELDDRLLPLLEAELAVYPNVAVVHGDILEVVPDALFDNPYKVVANVPYYITGAILRHLLSAHLKPTLMVLTVQKEVAERLTASPPDMSLLAVSVRYYGEAEIVTTIKAGSFWPPPDVDSAVVRIDVDVPEAQNPAAEKAFFRVVRAGFSQKRKQLQKNLRQLGKSKGAVNAALAASGIDGRRRAETLTLDEWRKLIEQLDAH